MATNTIKDVWNFNLRKEFEIIRKILPFSRLASFDTEFPGTIIRPNVAKHCLTRLAPQVNYSYMKANVDRLKLIQFGLTLSVSNPFTGAIASHVWQFNMKDFDIDSDSQNQDSIALLKEQGIDFAQNKVDGIDSKLLSSMLIESGLFCQPYYHRSWVTFHGAYDFGFIVKILTQSPLPTDLNMFMGLVQKIFGGAVFDMKHIMKSCKGLYGGLEKLGKTLQVERRAGGKSHQAGSDSLLTMEVFYRLKAIYLDHLPLYQIIRFENVIHGLEL